MVMLRNLSRSELESLGGSTEQTSTGVKTSCLGGAFTLFLDPNDKSLTPSIAQHFFWEAWITAWHVRNIAPDDIYIDIGANCGYYTFLAESLGAHSYAFEPNPKYIELMSAAAAYNGSHADINRMAISNMVGARHLNFYGNLDGSASIVGKGWDDKSIIVNTNKLDNYTFPAGKMVIKMDIEGAEELAFEGMKETLALRKPVLILEYSPGVYTDDFYKKLSEYGNVTLVNYAGVEEMTSKKFLDVQTDWVCLVVRP